MAIQESIFVTIGLGLVFVVLGSSRVLLIKFSVDADGKFAYLPVTVNVCSELIKCCFCFVIAMYIQFSEGKTLRGILTFSWMEVIQFLKWSIPGLLYFCDNLLYFYVIKYLQPAMVVLLGNFVIITTSVLFRIILKRKICQVQWASLMILFMSIVSLSSQSPQPVALDHHRHHAINHVLQNNTSAVTCHAEQGSFTVASNMSDPDPVVSTSTWQRFNIMHLHEGHLLILLQCLVSSAANIYNEKIFKEGNNLQDSIYIQNAKLYFFGVIFNSLTMVTHDLYRHKITLCGMFYGHNIYSVILIFLTAAYGLNVAFILKFRDNMFHLMSTQLITVLVISASVYFFHFRPSLQFFFTAPIVILAIYIYNAAKKMNVVTPPEPVRTSRRRRSRRNKGSASSSLSSEEELLIIASDPVEE